MGAPPADQECVRGSLMEAAAGDSALTTDAGCLRPRVSGSTDGCGGRRRGLNCGAHSSPTVQHLIPASSANQWKGPKNLPEPSNSTNSWNSARRSAGRFHRSSVAGTKRLTLISSWELIVEAQWAYLTDPAAICTGLKTAGRTYRWLRNRPVQILNVSSTAYTRNCAAYAAAPIRWVPRGNVSIGVQTKYRQHTDNVVFPRRSPITSLKQPVYHAVTQLILPGRADSGAAHGRAV